MAWITSSELKSYKAITVSGDDALLDTLIMAAQNMIESYTGRLFSAGADETRYLDVARMVEGATLYLDKDLCVITSITNNADAASPVVLTATDYVTVPRNETPYHAIRLTNRGGQYWRYTYNPEDGIKIIGKWAFCSTPLPIIKQACTRLAAYFYQLRDAQIYDVTAMPEQGIMILPKGLPQDIKVMLDPYRKLI